MTESGINHAELREAALRLLARREHSYLELVHKLTRRGWPEAEVEALVDELAGENLQSDERFAESYVRSRVARHYGPIRIRAELGERGIDRVLAERILREQEVDWFGLAADWYQRRYGTQPAAEDLRERSRRQQALARRGFAHEHVRELFD